MLTSDEMRENEMARRNTGKHIEIIMPKVPNSIRLLMTVWEQHDRFVPNCVRGWEPGQMLSDVPEWRWDGSEGQGGHDLHLDLFHNWIIIDQQTFLENAVGYIFAVLSRCPQTVIQIKGAEVSVKNRELKQVLRYTNGCMLENLFNAIMKMIEVGWLPTHKSKDGKYHYTQSAMEKADHDYELGLLKASKEQMEKRLAAIDTPQSCLPKDDPFADSGYFGRGNIEVDMLTKKIKDIKKVIGNKEVISSLDWRP